jgi:hypothetical protein
MITENQIKEIINRAIPLDLKCAINRALQMEKRARLRIDIEELIRKPKPFEPRTELK